MPFYRLIRDTLRQNVANLVVKFLRTAKCVPEILKCSEKLSIGYREIAFSRVGHFGATR